VVIEQNVYADLMTGAATSACTAGTFGAARASGPSLGAGTAGKGGHLFDQLGAAALRTGRLILAHDQGFKCMTAGAANKIMQWHGRLRSLSFFRSLRKISHPPGLFLMPAPTCRHPGAGRGPGN